MVWFEFWAIYVLSNQHLIVFGACIDAGNAQWVYRPRIKFSLIDVILTQRSI